MGSLKTDIANSKNSELRAADIIKNWIRNRGTLKFIGTWEQLYNPHFKVVEFDHFKMSSGLPSLADVLVEKYNLSHGMSIYDSIIASTCLIYDLPLMTYNLKDFRYINDLQLKI